MHENALDQLCVFDARDHREPTPAAHAALGEEVAYGYPNGLADFEILGVEPGSSARVVIPLRHPIPAGAVYRKHLAGSWGNFVVAGNDSISSAPGAGGACPAPGDGRYVAGLNLGNRCIELRLEDGGPNDGDSVPNGTIQDPGGLAVPVGVSLEILPAIDKTVFGNSRKIVVLALRLVSDSGDIELSSLTIQAVGSGDDRQIGSVRLIVDSDGNGVAEDSEQQIASGTFSQNDGTLRLQMTTPYAVPAGQTNLLVTYDF